MLLIMHAGRGMGMQECLTLSNTLNEKVALSVFHQTPKIPKIYINPVPKKSPKIFWGTFGDKTPKNPEIEVIPIP